MASTRTPRPVYILGAGFSKAISATMPITNALGDEVQQRLGDEVTIDLRPGQTFEGWLTAQLDPMPFLSPAEIFNRRGAASQVTETIAAILDEKQARATEAEPPAWLLRLVTKWHAERAVVITFNYDCLVERAINAAAITIGYAAESPGLLRGMDVVSPAPTRLQMTYFSDGDTNPRFESLTLIKLHGSLNWYRGDGDSVGSTLVADIEGSTLGQPEARMPRGNPELLAHMDRFIIPPVSDKSQHYGAYLVPALWKTARDAMAVATGVTFIGYSMPPEDRVSVELVAMAPHGVKTFIVDRTAFDPADEHALPSRLRQMGMNVVTEVPGDTAVADYTSELLAAAQRELVTLTSVKGPPSRDRFVVWSDPARHLGYQIDGFRVLVSDRTDPSVLIPVPVSHSGILSEPERFTTQAEHWMGEAGYTLSDAVRETDLYDLLAIGQPLRINAGTLPDGSADWKSVIAVQHVITATAEEGELVALFTVDGLLGAL